MPVGQTAPSPFAALLRRSKFASYDPSIGQVYTTYGGHAHRGQWGLKRPLPNRRRVGFITVRSVDTPEQQTEWNSAETSARWMKRWEELGKKLDVEEMGAWGANFNLPWSIDSEYHRAGKLGLEPSRSRQSEKALADKLEGRGSVPNPDTMSPKQFQRYLDRLRALRPEFKAYLEEKRRKEDEKARLPQGQQLKSERARILKVTGSGQIDMYASAQQGAGSHVNEFLAEKAANKLGSLESRSIERHPHKFAGLEYTFMSALQSQYLHKPALGRNIAQSSASQYVGAERVDKVHLIAVGGIVGALRGNRGAHNLLPTDFGAREGPRRDRERGKGVFRMSHVKLDRPPSTVGRIPEAADRTALAEIEFYTLRTAHANRSNPYPLGSPEYVAFQDSASTHGLQPIPGKVTQMVRQQRVYTAPQGNIGSGLLDSLTAMAGAVKK